MRSGCRRGSCLGHVLMVLMIGLASHVNAETDEYPPPDCGTASLFMLLRLNDCPTDLATVERALPSHNPQGYSMADLQAAARACGLRVVGVQARRQNLPLDRPAIAYFQQTRSGHFVLLHPVGVTGTMVQVLDPPRAPKLVDYEQLLSNPQWTGRLLVPQTTAERLISYAWLGCALSVLMFTIGPIRRRIPLFLTRIRFQRFSWRRHCR